MFISELTKGFEQLVVSKSTSDEDKEKPRGSLNKQRQLDEATGKETNSLGGQFENSCSRIVFFFSMMWNTSR